MKFNQSHMSGHFIKNSTNNSAISQEIKVGGTTILSTTEVNANGTVGSSGFSDKGKR